MGVDKRFSITMPEELYKRFEKFRYNYKYSTQTKAAIYLVQRGLDSLQEPEPKSEGEVIISDGRDRLMGIRFDQLDDEDKASLYNFAGYLLAQDKYKDEKSQ